MAFGIESKNLGVKMTPLESPENIYGRIPLAPRVLGCVGASSPIAYGIKRLLP
jgi:hypothetical protein